MNFIELDKLVVAEKMGDAENEYIEVRKSERLKGEWTAIEQFCWAEHAAKLNITEGISDVLYAYRGGGGVEPNSAKAFAWLTHGATLKGGERFYFELAIAYRDGDGTEVDIPKFWKYIRKAAQMEDGTEAMYHLALAHETPALGQLSQKQSLSWTTKMAEAGAAAGMTTLAWRLVQNDSAKDRESALSWAKKAVNAAILDVDTAKSSKSDPLVIRDWVYEDLPDALAAQADIFRLLGLLEEARKSDKEAAEAALAAIDLYVTDGKKSSLGLPRVMLREVAHCAPKGSSPSKDAKAYLDWLKRVGAAIELSQGDAIKPLPADLSGAVLCLAHAFKPGAGVDEDEPNYISWLKKAADWGNSEAAVEYAMHCRPTDPENFAKYIKKASEAGDNMSAYIYKVVDDCLSNSFDEVSKLLIKVLETTAEIRNLKHLVEEKDARYGIAHYTKPEALKGMLEKQTERAKNLIRLYNIAYANDPNEGKRLTHYKGVDSEYVNPLQPFYEKREDGDDTTRSKWQEFSVYQASFSLEPDNLNLWRFYGGDGTGFSVVTPLSAFNTALEHGAMGGAWASQDESSEAGSPLNSRASTITLNKVLYTNEDVEATLTSLEPSLAALNKWIESNKVDVGVAVVNSLRAAAVTILSELMYLYKEQDYKDESEVRVVEARPLGATDLQPHPGDSASFSRLYLETVAVLFYSKGSKIIIGPKVQNKDAVMLDIRHQLATMARNQCKVEHSLRPYR